MGWGPDKVEQLELDETASGHSVHIAEASIDYVLASRGRSRVPLTGSWGSGGGIVTVTGGELERLKTKQSVACGRSENRPLKPLEPLDIHLIH